MIVSGEHALGSGTRHVGLNGGRILGSANYQEVGVDRLLQHRGIIDGLRKGDSVLSQGLEMQTCGLKFGF